MLAEMLEAHPGHLPLLSVRARCSALLVLYVLYSIACGAPGACSRQQRLPSVVWCTQLACAPHANVFVP
jgi:hypothetical protein|eukprot:COSAG06_NODE_164_length_21596_cov_37.740500_9_plen_69_part_00